MTRTNRNIPKGIKYTYTPSALFDELLGGLSIRRFLDDYWQKNPLFVEQQDAVQSLLGQFDPVAKCLEWARHKKVEVLDGPTRADLTPEEAVSKIQAGGDVHLLLVDEVDPALQKLSSAVRAETQFIGPISMTVILTQSENPTSLHFDGRGVFNIQVTGRKTWRHASDVALSWPETSGFADKMDLSSIDDWQQVIYERIPARDALIEREMIPGSAIYIPSGLWHEVPAVPGTPALSVLISFDPFSWLRVLEEVMGDELVHLQYARAVEPGLQTAASWKKLTGFLVDRAHELSDAEIQRKFFGLMTRSSKCLLSPDTEIASKFDPEDPTQEIVHSYAGAMYLWDRRDHGKGIEIFSGPHVIAIEEEAYPLFHYIVCNKRFRMNALRQPFGTLSEQKVQEYIRSLIEGGVLDVVKSLPTQ